eukprot:scpid64260/ scgid26172/ 
MPCPWSAALPLERHPAPAPAPGAAAQRFSSTGLRPSQGHTAGRTCWEAHLPPSPKNLELLQYTTCVAFCSQFPIIIIIFVRSLASSELRRVVVIVVWWWWFKSKRKSKHCCVPNTGVPAGMQTSKTCSIYTCSAAACYGT